MNRRSLTSVLTSAALAAIAIGAFSGPAFAAVSGGHGQSYMSSTSIANQIAGAADSNSVATDGYLLKETYGKNDFGATGGSPSTDKVTGARGHDGQLFSVVNFNISTDRGGAMTLGKGVTGTDIGMIDGSKLAIAGHFNAA
jgi:hypothetical protein